MSWFPKDKTMLWLLGGAGIAGLLLAIRGQGDAAMINPALEPSSDQLATAANTTLVLASAALPSVIAGARAAGINTPERWAMWIAQTAHETGGYHYYRELWGPTAQQARYDAPGDSLAARLGNTQPGDGFRFRGRGLIQITGRDNYRKASDALGIDFITNPDAAAVAPGAGLVAAWFWNSHGLNDYADNGDVVGATKVINGGTTGLADRQQLYASASDVMGVGVPA